MSDRIREIQNRMKNLQGSDEATAALAYIPLCGWIVAYVKKECELCLFHGRQALQLNIVLLVVYFIVWILENFPFVAWIFGEGKLLHPISRSLWLLTAIGFLGLSVFGGYKAFSGERWEVPYLKDYLKKIQEMIRNTFA